MPTKLKNKKPAFTRLAFLTADGRGRERYTAEAEFQVTEIDEATGLPARFDAVLVVEGPRTTDGREIAVGALSWREPPLPLTNAFDTGDDHYGAVIGRIETLERVEVSADLVEIRGNGAFDLDSEAGREAARLVDEQFKRWVSIDLEIIEWEVLEEGDCEEDPFGPDCEYVLRVLEGRIMGAAQCAFPAFPQAVIVPEGTTIPDGDEDGRPAAEAVDAIAASIAGCAGCEEQERIAAALDRAGPAAVTAHAGPTAPPAAWFSIPEPDHPVPISVTPDGQVFGHAFSFDECHTGRFGECLIAPKSSSGYAYFLTGEVECDDGSSVPVGQLTLGCGHPTKPDGSPDLTLSLRQATAHYDGGPGATQWADVTIKDGKHGGWVCGRVRPGTPHAVVDAARAQAPSGDWRPIRGGLELCAITQVPVPGYPVPRAIAASGAFSEVEPFTGGARARVGKNGKVLALVAAGRVTDTSEDDLLTRLSTEVREMRDRFVRFERIAMTFEPQYRDALMESIRA